jgi:hypothetical protein
MNTQMYTIGQHQWTIAMTVYINIQLCFKGLFTSLISKVQNTFM